MDFAPIRPGRCDFADRDRARFISLDDIARLDAPGMDTGV